MKSLFSKSGSDVAKLKKLSDNRWDVDIEANQVFFYFD
jgi:hypothetical protein